MAIFVGTGPPMLQKMENGCKIVSGMDVAKIPKMKVFPIVVVQWTMKSLSLGQSRYLVHNASLCVQP